MVITLDQERGECPARAEVYHVGIGAATTLIGQDAFRSGGLEPVTPKHFYLKAACDTLHSMVMQ
jgi:hypothetical protein